MTLDNLILLSGTGTRWLQLFVALSLLIILHEFGHYWFAKKFKMRVEKFYLFFDFLFPLSTVLNFSLFKKKVGDTEYGVGWFPLGGYVKIAGMVDESMDKEQLAQAPQEWEYRAKPAWMRLLTMLGGIIVNILVAMIVYSVVFGVYGEKYLRTENATYGIVPTDEGKAIGLKPGDKLIGTDGKKIERFRDIFMAVSDGAHKLDLVRDGQPMSLTLPDKTFTKPLYEVRAPAVIGDVSEKSEALRMGLKKDDSLISINEQPVMYFDQMKTIVESLKNKPVRVKVIRAGNQTAVLSGMVDTNGKLGVAAAEAGRVLKLDTIHYNPIQAIGRGITFTGESFVKYAAGFSKLFKKDVKLSENLGGIGSFSKVFPTEFDMEEFLGWMAFISIILAFMNLLPIPGLDGGYVIFLLYELVTRRKVSEKVMEVATTVGLVLLLGLMLYANGLDVLRAFKK